eukprot:TRINITY_DN1197_c0_g1_i2.p4 TRINITY_DN1197_c0_g1~~TRINITY_DN1197_c0_g1_i2.p4  ORF type:complete len:283 (-),score=27.09 TRINITY_DN1197_c0_g1_i2:1697-2545(-)
MEKVFEQVVARKEKMGKFLNSALSRIVSELPTELPSGGPMVLPKGGSEIEIEGRQDIFPCKICNNSRMRIIVSKKGQPFLGCSSFPTCKNSAFFPRGLSKISVLEETCGVCSAGETSNPSYMVKFEFVEEVKAEVNQITKKQTFCLNGCDEEEYKKLMGIRYNSGRNMGEDAKKRNTNKTANKENTKTNKGKKKYKKCSVCGIVGAHPKGFNCPGKKTRKGGSKKPKGAVPQHLEFLIIFQIRLSLINNSSRELKIIKSQRLRRLESPLRLGRRIVAAQKFV